MAGLSFISTGFLIAGAAAAALPILIHLLLKQRARMMPIGTVRFLQDVVRQHSRRRKIRQWILLAMRVLAILLLAMLFARPYWDRSALQGLNREAAVLLDRSASTQARGAGGETVFAAGLERARRELAGLDDNTAVHLALFDSEPRQTDVSELDEARPLDAATDFAAALSWARDIMTVSSRPHRQVILISDLQRSGLHRSEMADFPADVDLVIRDVGRTMSRNVSLVSAEAVATEIRPGEPVRVEVRVRNSGALAAKQLAVELMLQGPGGPLEARRTIELAGGASRTVEFELPKIQQDGVYYGAAAAAVDDDLLPDNRRWLAFQARRPDRLLLVDGQQGRSVYANETYYLETALRLRAPAAAAPLRSFEIERIVWEDGDGFPDLAGHRAVVMANVGRLTDVDARRLREYVSGGGNLLFFCGDQTRNRFMSRLRRAGLFPARVRNGPLTGPWRVDQWQREHPVLRPFRDAQNGDLRTLRFDTIVDLFDLADSAQVLISAAGQPILVEQRLGEGSAMFFASAADRQWSRWAQSRLYVPLVRQMMAYLTQQLDERQAVVQKTVGPGDTAGILEQDGHTVVWNLDADESLLDRVSEADLRDALGIAERDPDAVLAELAEGVETPRGAERANESWKWLAWLLLALLTAEVFLASRVHT